MSAPIVRSMSTTPSGVKRCLLPSAAEPGSLFTQFAVGGKGEYLKAAGIGQNRAVPAVELMESSSLAQHIESRSEIEVICVSEYDLRIDILLKLMGMYRLDTADGAYGHEYRGRDTAMVCGYLAGSRFRAWCGGIYLEIHFKGRCLGLFRKAKLQKKIKISIDFTVI